MIVDLTDRLPKLTTESPSGTAMTLFWHRLVEVLREHGDVRESESVTHITVSERGLQLHVRTRPGGGR